MNNIRLFGFLGIFLFIISTGLNAKIINLKNNSAILADTSSSNLSEFSVESIDAELHKTNELLLHLSNNTEFFNYDALNDEFTKQALNIDKEANDFRSYNPYNLSKFFLNNVFLVWSNYRVRFNKWQLSVSSQLEQVTADLNKIVLLEKKWKSTLKLTKKEHLPHIETRINKYIEELEKLRLTYKEQESKLLSLEARISDKIFLCDQMLTETNKLKESLRKKTFSKTERVIWHIQLFDAFEGTFFSKIKQAWNNNFKSAQYYFSSIGFSFFSYLFWASVIIFMVLFTRKKYQKLNLSSDVPGHVSVVRVLENHPYAVILATLLLLWTIIFPFIPLLLSDSILIAIIISLGVILQSFIDHVGKRVFRTLLLLLILNIFELVFWYLGDYVRLYLAFESGIAVFLIFHFFALFRENKQLPSDHTRIIKLARRIVPYLLVFYIIAFLANIFGYVNLTVFLMKVGIRTAAITMIAYGYIRIFNSFNMAVLSLIEREFPNFASRYIDIIKKRVKITIDVLIFLLWFRATLTILEFQQDFINGLRNFLTNELQIGSISISLSNILLFIVILLVTYYITVFIKKILENEILSSLRLPRGIPAAISMMLRIFFVTLGVIFAISAAGINMSKFSMIAGALGVGIGFGLQNIVQNFISGLILIFERPIHVGDTVEVNNLLGRVKDIGVRASSVLTYDGAEVVVPNSNLISNDLINWTLSDSRKRVEIKVGTAYGSDPNKVLEILKLVAAQNEMVVKNPEPLALFDGFGDSSLDFRLLFWVNFEFGLTTKSDIAIAIYNKFAENNIEIPFPQVDLHVKDVADNKNTAVSEKVIEPKITKKNPDAKKD